MQSDRVERTICGSLSPTRNVSNSMCLQSMYNQATTFSACVLPLSLIFMFMHHIIELK